MRTVPWRVMFLLGQPVKHLPSSAPPGHQLLQECERSCRNVNHGHSNGVTPSPLTAPFATPLHRGVTGTVSSLASPKTANWRSNRTGGALPSLTVARIETRPACWG